MAVRIQFDFPFELYKRLLNHPAYSWGDREKFYVQIFTNFINSPEFRLKEIEKQARSLTWERDQARRERDVQAKSAEFWRSRAADLQKAQQPTNESAQPKSDTA
jgi:hypothetical protein